eukprot:1912609-Prymnesium_polylepis.1
MALTLANGRYSRACPGHERFERWPRPLPGGEALRSVSGWRWPRPRGVEHSLAPRLLARSSRLSRCSTLGSGW